MDRQALFVGSGDGETLRVIGADVKFLCAAERTDKHWSLMEVELPEGAGPPPHVHAWDEAYYVLAGEIAFTLADTERKVRPGDFLYAPGGTLHGFKGASREPARLLVFDAPAHTESFFREVDREVKAPADMARVPEIGRRHGIEFRRP